MAEEEKMKDKWIPEIYYEENKEGSTMGLPFIKVPVDKLMPSAMFFCEVKKDTSNAEDEDAVVFFDVHCFANMTVLKSSLSSETFDQVREALGLEPLSVAHEKGEKISNNVNKNINN